MSIIDTAETVNVIISGDLGIRGSPFESPTYLRKYGDIRPQ
ncbi:MAG: hypothetical protein ACFFB0_12420 [Promethearchaeota archaeon]